MYPVRPVARQAYTTPDPGIVADFRFHPVYGLRDVSGRSNGAFTSALPSTGGKTYDRYGILQSAGADVPRLTGNGLLDDPGSTNKCTCVKFNPQNITNIIMSGDAAAVLSVVNDSAELAKAGLSAFGPNVYKIDATLCTSGANCVVSGYTGNTNKHSVSAYIRSNSAVALFGLNDASASAPVYDCVQYKRARIENVTPAGTTNRLRITTGAGTVVYFTLPQLEELPYCTSIIVGDNSAYAVTRASEHAVADGSNGNTLLLSAINPVAAEILQGKRTAGGTILWHGMFGSAHPNTNVSILTDAGLAFRGLYVGAGGGFNWQGDAGAATATRSKFLPNVPITAGFSCESATATECWGKAFVTQPDGVSVAYSGLVNVGPHVFTRLGPNAASVGVPAIHNGIRIVDRPLTTAAEILDQHDRYKRGVL